MIISEALRALRVRDSNTIEDSPPGGLIRTDYFCTVIVEMKVVGRLMDAKGGGSVDDGRERRRG